MTPSIKEITRYARGKDKVWHEIREETKEQEKWKTGVDYDDWKKAVVIVMLILGFVVLLASGGIIYACIRRFCG